MKAGDLIKNKHTRATALILGNSHGLIDGHGYGESMEWHDYEILLCEQAKTMIVPREILWDHWEMINEN